MIPYIIGRARHTWVQAIALRPDLAVGYRQKALVLRGMEEYGASVVCCHARSQMRNLSMYVHTYAASECVRAYLYTYIYCICSPVPFVL